MENLRTTAAFRTRKLAKGKFQKFTLAPPDGVAPLVDAVESEFGRFVEQSESAAHPKQLFDLLSAFALKCGFPWIGYYHPAHDQDIARSARDYTTTALNYPGKWQQRYIQMGFQRIDPIIKRSRRQAEPFRWCEVYKDRRTTEVERNILEQAATFGLKGGVSIPLHGPGSDFAVMSFVQPYCHEVKSKTVAYLQSSALWYHQTIARFVEAHQIDKFQHLSNREMECISWVAKGKSSWDIGAILGISENTVNFHIKKVNRKLDASNRTVAAIKAAILGIIDP